MKKALGMALFLLLTVSFLPGQEWKGQGRLPGLVVDEQGKPIEGVRVKLFCPKFNGGFETTTGKDGKWTGAWMRSGLWDLDFDKPGYAPVRKSLQFDEYERHKELEVVMKKAEGLSVTDEMKKELTAANDLYDKGQFEAAIEAYKAFLAKFPDAYFIWRNIGNSYFRLEKYDEAEAAYKQVLVKDPNDALAIISIGNCYANRGETDKAMEWYGKVSLDSIADSNLLYAAGLAYFKASKLDEARQYLEKAVEVDETNADAIYQLGLTYTSLNDKPKAIATFEKYLKVDPDSQRATQVKGFLEYLRK
jgi:tetratricopeptide (TPR) repeat protein